MGAKDPSEGGNFIRDVVEGKHDQDVGKAIRFNMIQPWLESSDTISKASCRAKSDYIMV